MEGLESADRFPTDPLDIDPLDIDPRPPGEPGDKSTNELNQILRRLRSYRTEAEWTVAFLDGAKPYAEQLAVFILDGDLLRLRGQHNLNIPADLTFPLASAKAFANAILSKDSVVALRTPGEVGESLSLAGKGTRLQLVPIQNGERVVAVLFAGGDRAVSLHGLELIAGMSSLVLERKTNAARNIQIALPAPSIPRSISREETPSRSRELLPGEVPQLAGLSDADRTRHLRAQRFARVRVAEMQLNHPDACRAGREQNDVYLFLKTEIDSARDFYRSHFMTVLFMVDYLHLELVHSAAEGDESRLGEDYPGQLA